MPDSVRFEELRIRHAPGFESEGFSLKDLSPGINLIYGANGSGKSTTGRAITRLLWPALEDGERVSLRGRFSLGGVEWTAEVDGTRTRYRRDGAEAAAPLLPSAEGHCRYHLALADLLREKDQGFAAAIARESAGGYDLRRSGRVLDPRGPVSRRQPQNDALDRARAEYDEAVARQRGLRVEERELAELRSRFRAADESLRRVVVLEAALDHARAAEAERVARAELNRFAAEMHRVGGDEYERLCRLRDRVRKGDEDRKRAEQDAGEARLRSEGLSLPEESLREELLRGLEYDLERLRSADQNLSHARRAYAEALAKLENEGKRLGGSVDADKLAAADLGTITDVGNFARRAQAVAARRAGVEAQLRVQKAPPVEEDLRRIAEGIRLLERWLREPTPAPQPQVNAERASRLAGVTAGVLLTVGGVLIAILSNPLYLVLAVVGGMLLWPMLRRTPAPAAAVHVREVHRRAYEKLDLDRPGSWDPTAVETLLDRLQDRAVAARDAELLQRRRRELEEERAAAAAEERRIEADRRGTAERLGVAAETGLTELVWIAEAVGRWQAAQSDVAGEGEVLRTAEREAAALAESLRSRLEPLGYNDLATVGALAGAIQTFSARRHDLQAERERQRVAAATLRELARQRGEHEREIQELFDTLGLEPGRDDTVRQWCETRAEYHRAYETHRKAESVLGAARARLETCGGEESLLALPVHELEAEIEAERGRAAPRDRLAREITATETRIDEAKRSHGIEEALARLEGVEYALRRAREKDVRSAVAQVLIDSLERATRDQHLPAVFRRAREILVRITHGRYELRLRQDGEAEFTAFDRIDRLERRLHELSSGTRVQLLLSVRVAFVEQQEQGVMLPLLMDEVLGNSDDERARAIMEAAVELAREGRQIFYFTAQADEIARWRTLAAEGVLTGIALREIDLDRERGSERGVEIPAVIPAPRPLPPLPAGADYGSYGRRLRVPRLDRAKAEAAAVHLWYFLDEPEALHRLLVLGPDRWGPLRALVQDGGHQLVGDRLFIELEACSRVVQAFLEAARIGVRRHVDRAVLEDSGAVTRTFLDRVDDLAGELGGDGVRLVEALEAGVVPRFTRKSKDGLREYLEAEGYLSREEPLELEEIRTRVLARAANDITTGVIGIDRIDGMLGRLWVGVGGGPPESMPILFPRVQAG